MPKPLLTKRLKAKFSFLKDILILFNHQVLFWIMISIPDFFESQKNVSNNQRLLTIAYIVLYKVSFMSDILDIKPFTIITERGRKSP